METALSVLGTVAATIIGTIWKRHYAGNPKTWESFLLALGFFVASAAGFIGLVLFIGSSESDAALILLPLAGALVIAAMAGIGIAIETAKGLGSGSDQPPAP